MSPPTCPLRTAVVVLLICFPVSSPAGGNAEGTLQLQVLFHDYVSAPDRLLQSSVEIAEEVYRPADIEIEWLDCTSALEGESSPAPCTQAMRPTTLVVQLPTRRMANAVPVSARVLGYAVAAGEGKFATRASLFYDRIRSYSTAEGLSATALLGMALAHEIGHLLLGRDSHSEQGLMSCPWSRKDIVEAARGRLRFEPVQLMQIRDQLLARGEAERLALTETAD